MAELDLNLAEWALDEAKKFGATAAEVLLVSGESLSAGVRLGEVEKLKSSRERRLGLRVFTGQSSSTSSPAELEQDSLRDFIKSTVDLARLSAPARWSGLPDANLHPDWCPDLELGDEDSGIIAATRALELARLAENGGLKAVPRIK